MVAPRNGSMRTGERKLDNRGLVMLEVHRADLQVDVPAASFPMTRVAFVPRSAALRSAGLAFARKLRIEIRGTLMVGFDRIENGSSVVSSILNQLDGSKKECMNESR